MKKVMIFMVVIIFGTTGIGLAKGGGQGKHQQNARTGKSSQEGTQSTDQQTSDQSEKEQQQDRERTRERSREHDQAGQSGEKPKAGDAQGESDARPDQGGTKAKGQGQKTEPPKGVQNAAEKGKGKKKGLFERWFGGSTDDKGKEKK